MRTIFAVAALLAATPAVADQAAIDRYTAEQREKIAAMRADYAKRQTDQAAACSRLGGVRIGLTAEGVTGSCWGKPYRVNTTSTPGHRQEQWVYGPGQYVYLTDGRVTAIQTSR